MNKRYDSLVEAQRYRCRPPFVKSLAKLYQLPRPIGLTRVTECR